MGREALRGFGDLAVGRTRCALHIQLLIRLRGLRGCWAGRRQVLAFHKGSARLAWLPLDLLQLEGKRR